MSNSITVSTSNQKNIVQATADLSNYYSRLSKDWAISNQIVNNEDYSSKYYANIAKEYSNNAIQKIQMEENKAINNIDIVKDSAVNEIDEYIDLSKDWATKMDGNVQDTDYSSKYYAQISKSKADDTIEIYNSMLNQSSSFLNKTQVTNAILEAPNGLCTYTGNTITAKSGLKILAPNGRNEDGSLKNIEYTLASDTSKELPSAGTGLLVFFLRSLDNGQTWDIGYRAYDTQWYIQEEQPQVEHCEWYNPKTNLWKHCVSGEWSDILICPLGRMSCNEGQILSLYNYETTDLLKRSDRGEIIEWDRPNLTQSALQLKAYNTQYIAEEDGWVYFNTHLRATANVFNNGAAGIQVYGIIDEINVYGHMVNTSWDGSVNSVTVANMHTLITKVYKGQTYKIYTHDSNGGSVISYQLGFIPFAKKGA